MPSLERIIDPRLFEVYYFDKHPMHNAAWDAVEAPDGRVYVGLCNEGRPGLSAAMYVLDMSEKDPARRLRFLLDVDKVTHDDTSLGHIPQSKFHTSMAVGGDGRLYTTTHTTAPGYGRPFWTITQDFDDIRYRYPGSHFLVYDPTDESVEDWGIPIPGESVYGACLDWPNRKYYMLSQVRGHLVTIDLNTGKTEDLGRFTRGGQCVLFMDRKGRVWSADLEGRFVHYDPATGRFDKLAIEMPRPAGRENFGNSIMPPVYWKEGKWCGTMLFEGRIWVLDTEAKGGPTIEDYGMGWGDFVPGRSGQVQPWELQFGPDGKLYYGIAAFAVPENCYFLAGLKLIQFDMQTRERRNLGMLWADERPGFLFASRFSLPDGRLGWVDSCYWGAGARVVVFDVDKLKQIESPSLVQKRMKYAITDAKYRKDEQCDRCGMFASDSVSRDAVSVIEVFEHGFPWKSCAVSALDACDDNVWGGVSGESAGLFVWNSREGSPHVTHVATFRDASGAVSVLTDASCALAAFKGKGRKPGFIVRATLSREVERLTDLPGGHQPLAVARVDDNVYVLTNRGSLLRHPIGSAQIDQIATVPAVDLSAVLVAVGNALFGCLQNGQVFTVDAVSGEATVTDSFIPAAHGRQYEAKWQSAVVRDGYIFGGTSDGYVFRMKPDTRAITNLGKPLLSLGIPALAASSDGTIYGTGGRPDGIAHLFRYTDNDGFQDLGMLSGGKDTLWRSFRLGSATCANDGTLYVGEADDMSNLWRCRFE